jgi:hypothetical protein
MLGDAKRKWGELQRKCAPLIYSPILVSRNGGLTRLCRTNVRRLIEKPVPSACGYLGNPRSYHGASPCMIRMASIHYADNAGGSVRFGSIQHPVLVEPMQFPRI